MNDVTYYGPTDGQVEDIRTAGITADDEWNPAPRDLTDTPAHRKLRDTLRTQPPAPRRRLEKPDPVINLARTLHERRRQKAQAALANQKETPEEPMTTLRTKLAPQEEAWLEMLIRAGNPDDELARYRVARGIHHKTFGAAVRRIRERIDQAEPPSSLAREMEQLLAAAETVQDRRAAPAAEPITAPPAPVVARPAAALAPAAPAQLDPLIHWLTGLRAMRDQLAEFGVTVEGTLQISIDL